MDGTRRLLALIMAGGKGSRLNPLTAERAKPAVPFGGRYRIIDFVLSNMQNSGVRAVYVLTQYKAQSLVEHVQRAWGFRSSYDQFVTVVPAQMRVGETWYRGTADSVFQNFHLIEEFRPDAVLVFGADHVYRMNVRQMSDFHFERGSVATVACLPVPVAEAHQFGIVQIDEQSRIIGFQEKPTENPITMPGDSTKCLASMGNYIFNPGVLADSLRDDARAETHHDFGRNVIPSLVASTGKVFAYDFAGNRIRGASDAMENAYWRDVGTIDAYYEANMDLKAVVPQLNLYNWDWPILTVNHPDPPAKFVFDEDGRRGMVVQSILSGGCIISGGFVKDSVLGRNVTVEEGAEVRDSILFDNVYIGKRARIRKAIIDKNVRVADGDHVGHDLARDAIRHTVSEGGVTVVPKARDTIATRSRNL